MTDPFRDDTEAAIMRADAVEDELARAKAETQRLRALEAELAAKTAENERRKAENERLRPHPATPPLEGTTRGADDPTALKKSLVRRFIDCVFERTYDSSFGSLGQALFWCILMPVVVLFVLGLVCSRY